MRILAFKLSPLGDTVMFAPVIQALTVIPGIHVTAFVTPVAAPLLRPTASAHEWFVLETERLRKAWRRPWELVRWLRRVRRAQPDAVLLSYDQPSVARLLSGLSGAPVRAAGGAAAARWRHGVSHTVHKAPEHSLAEWDWEIARAAMLASGRSWPARPEPPRLLAHRSDDLPPRPRILVHAGASRPYQRWHGDRFAALASGLAADFDVTWIDRPELSQAPPAGVAIARPRDFAEFAGLAAGAALFVGNHSGAFHVAAALGTPCLVVAGPSPRFCDPPWFVERRRILRADDLPCLPCDGLTISAGACRNTATPMACMNRWSVGAVLAACHDMLGGARPLRR